MESVNDLTTSAVRVLSGRSMAIEIGGGVDQRLEPHIGEQSAGQRVTETIRTFADPVGWLEAFVYRDTPVVST